MSPPRGPRLSVSPDPPPTIRRSGLRRAIRGAGRLAAPPWPAASRWLPRWTRRQHYVLTRVMLGLRTPPTKIKGMKRKAGSAIVNPASAPQADVFVASTDASPEPKFNRHVSAPSPQASLSPCQGNQCHEPTGAERPLVTEAPRLAPRDGVASASRCRGRRGIVDPRVRRSEAPPADPRVPFAGSAHLRPVRPDQDPHVAPLQPGHLLQRLRPPQAACKQRPVERALPPPPAMGRQPPKSAALKPAAYARRNQERTPTRRNQAVVFTPRGSLKHGCDWPTTEPGKFLRRTARKHSASRGKPRGKD